MKLCDLQGMIIESDADFRTLFAFRDGVKSRATNRSRSANQNQPRAEQNQTVRISNSGTISVDGAEEDDEADGNSYVARLSSGESITVASATS
jgi:hypothetical protein